MKWPAGLNRQVFLLGLVSLFSDISSEMLTPVTPLFLTAVLGGTALDVGVIEGFAQATASLLKVLSGKWSDRIVRRKPFIVMGYLAAAVAKPMIGLARVWPEVLAARMVDRFGKGLREAPRDALLADVVEVRTRALSYGWHRGMDTTGAVIGSALAVALMMGLGENLRLIYFLALGPGLCSVILTLLVREPVAEARSAHREESNTETLSASFKGYLAGWAIFCLGNSSDAFLVLRAKSAGFSTVQTIGIYACYNIVYALASPFLGGVADRVGRKQVLIGGLLVFSAVYGGFAWMAAPAWAIVALFTVYGLYAAATDGVGKALAVDLLPKGARAYGLGLLGAVTGLGALAASIGAGLLWDRVGPSAAFLFGAGAAALSALSLLWVPARD